MKRVGIRTSGANWRSLVSKRLKLSFLALFVAAMSPSVIMAQAGATVGGPEAGKVTKEVPRVPSNARARNCHSY